MSWINLALVFLLFCLEANNEIASNLTKNDVVSVGPKIKRNEIMICSELNSSDQNLVCVPDKCKPHHFNP